MSYKKSLSIFLCLLMVVFALSACGGTSNNGGNNNGGKPANNSNNAGAVTPDNSAGNETAKPSELTVWADDDPEKLETLQSITDKYTEQTGISVKITPIAMNDQPQALSLDGPSGNGPDLFYQPGIGKLSVQGLVQPMTVDSDILSRYTQESLGALSYDGQLYGLPFVVETYAMLYNTELTPEPPKTIAELEALAKAQTNAANDEYGFLYDATNFYFSWAFMGGSGGYIFKPAGDGFDIHDIGFNQQGAVKGASLIQSWFEKGYLPKGVNGDIVGGLFNQGKVAAIINGPWAITDHKANLGDKLAVAPLPVMDDGAHPESFIGIKGWMLSAYSKNAEWATDLAVFLTNAESTLAWFQETGETPPNLEVLDNPALVNDPLVAGFSEQIKYGVPFPNVAELDHVWDPMANALKFISEGENVQEIMDEAVADIEDRIKMAGADAQ